MKGTSDIEFPVKLPTLTELTTKVDQIGRRVDQVGNSLAAFQSGSSGGDAARAEAADARSMANTALLVGIRVASKTTTRTFPQGTAECRAIYTSLRSRELDRYFALVFTRSSGRVARCVLYSTGPARGLEDRNNAAKLLRACGGCLGASRR